MFGLIPLITGVMGGLSGRQQAAVGLTGILLPVGLIIGGFIYGSVKYDKGVSSRDVEVAEMQTRINAFIKSEANLKSTLSACRATNETVSKENRRLTGLEDTRNKAHIEALKAERENTRAARQATQTAINAINAGRSNNSDAFDDLKDEFEEMLKNATDENGNRCIVRGGKRLLRNARVGKIQK